MREFWVYDWECYYNFACVTFIHSTTDKAYLEAYKQLDILYLKVLHDIEDNLLTDNWNELTELESLVAKYKVAKTTLLGVMNAKTFFFYNDQFDKSKNICQIGELLMFFNNHKVLCGYNSVNYDSHMTDFILIAGHNYNTITGKDRNNIHITTALKTVSDEIINVAKGDMYNFKYAWKPYKYYRTFEDYDIQKILYLNATFTGLKSVAINLKWHRIQELPLPPDSIIAHNQLWLIYDYNINDVLITLELLLNQEEEVVLREQISEAYDVNVLNDSRSSIGKRLMSKFYEEESGIPYKDFRDLRTYRGLMNLGGIVTNRIVFTTPKFQEFLKSIKSITVSPSDKFERKFEYNGTFYNIAKGGIHSIDDSRLYSSDDGAIYRDCDVNSYYPAIITIFEIHPEHINKDIFLKIVYNLMTDRLKAKKLGKTDPKQKLKAEALKIVINRIYGALKDATDYLFDPKATYMTTMNGQLSLLMLVEKLETNGIHVISANTDGLISRFLPEQETLYTKLCTEWETQTGFGLEYTDYEKYARSNVNNYLAIKTGFYKSLEQMKLKCLIETDEYKKELNKLEDKYIKCKGTYSSETPFNKGFTHPIVSIALYQYLVYNKDYKETILNHVKLNKFNIYDYCMSQKVAKTFGVHYLRVVDGNLVKTEIQQYNRFYIVASGGGTITKEDVYTPVVVKSTNTLLSRRPSSKTKAKPKSIARSESLVANQNIELFNDYIEKEDYNLDYNFYINKVEDYLFYKRKSSKGNHKLEGLEVRDIDLFNQIEIVI